MRQHPHPARPTNGSGTDLRLRSALQLKPSRLALALASASLLSIATDAAWAQPVILPTGGSVVHGQATIVTSGGRMTVTNSSNAILNWQSFSVGKANAVRFDQPSVSSQVLNRVLGNDPSQIFGNLSSNGKVWLLNPNGVLFGRDARVDVASLVASTLNVNDHDWLAGRFQLTNSLAGGNNAAIINQGQLRTTLGGQVALLAGEGGVRNEGLIEAPGGQVLLAAGQSINLVDTGVPNLALRVTAPQGEALNLGSVLVAGGRIDIQAAIVNQQGIVRADAIGQGAAGEVRLRASQSLDIAAGSVTSANGASGGQVLLDGGAGTALVAGNVAATASAGVGGDVRLTGRHVGVLDGGSIDASGALGGGEILVGGGAHGMDTSVANAEATYIAPTASLAADAIQRGDGGRVIVWSDHATRAYGRFSARGGAQGGDGGLVETSGGWLDARPSSILTTAPKGRAGRWLLDPNDIDIVDGIYDYNISSGPNFTTLDDLAVITTATITSALNAGNNVSITTSSAGSNTQHGDIRMDGATISAAPTSPVSLTLTASRNIEITASTIETTASPMAITLSAANGASGVGAVLIDNSTLSSRGGAINIGGAATAVGAHGTAPFAAAVGYDPDDSGADFRVSGVSISNNSRIDALNGSVIVSGASIAQYGEQTSTTTGFFPSGVELQDSTIQGGSILLQGWVDSEQGAAGTRIANSTLSAPGGTVTINGSGTSNGSFLLDQDTGLGFYPRGVNIFRDSSVSASSIAVNGSMNSTESDVVGFILDGASLTASGGITLTGSSPVWALALDHSTVSAGTTLTATAPAGDIGADASRLSSLGSFSLNASGAQNGVDVSGGSTLQSGGAMTISANGADGFIAMDRSSLGAGGALGLSATGAGGYITLASSPLSATGAINLLTGVGGFVQLDDSVTAGGTITVRTDDLALNVEVCDQCTPTAARLEASAPGNAIVIAGAAAATNTTTMLNSAGSAALSTPNGRWLVYATDPTDGVNFDAGGLAHGATYYNTTFPSTGTPAIADQNLLLFSLAPQLSAASGGQPIVKTYDGSALVNVSSFQQIQGAINGDQVFGRFSDPNAGIGKAIVLFPAGAPVQAIDAQGRPVYGYGALGAPFTLSGDVARAPLTLSGVVAANKVYDGNTVAAISGGALAGLVGTESLTLISGNSQFDNKDAGIGKTVTGTVALADGANGGLAGNYLLGSGTFTTSADITRRPLTLGGVTAANKVYDGTTTATLAGGTLVGLVGAETLALGSLSGQFDTKDAGTGKTVTGTVALADGANGGLANNYSLASGAVTTTADITRRPLTLGGVTAANKVYDGTTAATLAGGALVGLVGAESLTLATGNGRFDTKDAGTGKTVTGTVTLADGANGGLAGNYSLASAAFTTSADITRRPLTLSGVAADNKVYDGNTIATIGGGVLAGLVGTEGLTLSSSNARFDSKDAGSGKTVTGTATLADGANGGLAGNYSLASGAFTTTADIDRANLAYVAQPQTLLLGLPAPSFTGTVTGFVGEDTLQNSTTGSLMFAASTSTFTVPGSYAIQGFGLSAMNYVFSQAPSNATALVVLPSTEVPPESIVGLKEGIKFVVLPPATTSPTQGRTVDVSQWLQVNPSDGSTSFRGIPISQLSLETLASLLTSREKYKEQLFGEAIEKLERDPTLADAPLCATARQAATGSCLITETLKQEVASLSTQRVGAAPMAAPAPAQAAAPAPAAAAAAPPAAPATAKAPASTAAESATVSAAIAELLATGKRPIKSAVLPQINRKIAVLIGGDVYADKRIPRLGNAVSDARALATIFNNNLGYETVVLQNATKSSIIRTLNLVAAEAGPKDSIVVYYAGHGQLVPATGLGYWLPADADATKPETWLSNSDIGKLIALFGSSQVALISDSCFSGSLVSSERIRPSPAGVDAEALLSHRAAVVMTSGGNEPVFDDGQSGHSPFAFSLMQALQQVPNWQPGGNVFERVRFAVARKLPQRPRYGAALTAGHQTGSDYLFELRELAPRQ
jgi:filamentous hemagglutinin family protein